jgi:hypothetical protein
MYYRDHHAPHFHAIYAVYEAQIVIDTLEPLARAAGSGVSLVERDAGATGEEAWPQRHVEALGEGSLRDARAGGRGHPDLSCDWLRTAKAEREVQVWSPAA